MADVVSCSISQFQSDMCLSMIDTTVSGFLVELLIFVIAFVGLAVAAEHLCNSMETLCDHWNISEDVGGATFIALGGAIPEITINCISTFKSAGSTGALNASVADMGVGAILGSGMIAYLLIPSLSTLFANDKLLLRQKSLYRDASFYCLAVLVLMSSLFFGVGKYHAPILVGIYVCYVLVLVFSEQIHFWWSHAVGHPHLGPVRPSGSPNVQSVFREKYSSAVGDFDSNSLVPLLPLNGPSDLLFDEESDNQQKSGAVTTFSSFLYSAGGAVVHPLKVAIDATCPDCRIFKAHEKFYPVTFATSFAWITFFSFVVTVVVQRWVELLNMPSASAMFGLILVAAGAEVPDTVNAVTIARRGFGGMSTSACLGSQVVNICLGLGLPWLVASIAGRSVALNPTNFFIHEASQFLLIDVVLLVIIVAVLGPFHENGKAEINKPKALFLIAWYAVTLGYLGYSTMTNSSSFPQINT